MKTMDIVEKGIITASVEAHLLLKASRFRAIVGAEVQRITIRRRTNII